MHSTTRTNNTDENGGGDNGRDKKKSKRSARGSSNSNSGGGGGGRSSKRHQVMSASNQTDEERRELRDNQRALKRDILHSEVGESIEDPTSEAFVDIRGKNNALFNQVRYIREGVLDGENLTLISTRAARQVDKLIQVCKHLKLSVLL